MIQYTIDRNVLITSNETIYTQHGCASTNILPVHKVNTIKESMKTIEKPMKTMETRHQTIEQIDQQYGQIDENHRKIDGHQGKNNEFN